MRTAGAGLFVFAAGKLYAGGNFWTKKAAADWSSDEVLRLATNSPWATSAMVLPTPGRDRGHLQAGNPPDAIASGGGPQGLNDPRPGQVPVVPVTEVTVVWESAQPFLDSLKSTFPSDFDNHYVIGIHRLPIGEGKNKPNLVNSRATLTVKGKAPLDAGVIAPKQDYVLCGFSKELLTISPSDKEAVFYYETDQFSIKTKFEPKQMIYRGKLAV